MKVESRNTCFYLVTLTDIGTTRISTKGVHSLQIFIDSNILRRVKTWNWASMGDYRLSGLCMGCVHKKRLDEDTKFTEEIIKNLRKSLDGFNDYSKNNFFFNIYRYIIIYNLFK